jgi:hypothetical protein
MKAASDKVGPRFKRIVICRFSGVTRKFEHPRVQVERLKLVPGFQQAHGDANSLSGRLIHGIQASSPKKIDAQENRVGFSVEGRSASPSSVGSRNRLRDASKHVRG